MPLHDAVDSIAVLPVPAAAGSCKTRLPSPLEGAEALRAGLG